MFEKRIKEYDSLVKDYKAFISDTFNKQDFIEYNEILFFAHSCGIEGNSFSIDETRTLKEKSLGMIPYGKTLLESFEILDHFHAYEYLHPFRDGNGRLGRLFSNFILLLKNDLPLLIERENKNAYIEALKFIKKERTDEYLIDFFFRQAIERMKKEIKSKKNLTSNFIEGMDFYKELKS